MAIDDSLERARLHPDVLKNLNKNKKLKMAEAYSEDNPPPYPVTSVNGETGDVNIPTVDLPLPISEGGHAATTAAQAAKNLGVLPLGEVVTKITSGANLNDYVLPGVYAVSSNGIAATITNMPYQVAGTLRVFSANGAEVKADDPWKYLIQEYVILRGRTFFREGSSGSGATVTWTAWRTVCDSTDYPFSITNGGTGANNAADARANLGLGNVALQAAVKAVTSNGSSSNTLSGLTANHVVGNWGLFSDASCTTPISVNQPTCDITITTSANAWTLTIANFSSTFYIRPTFVLKQN